MLRRILTLPRPLLQQPTLMSSFRQLPLNPLIMLQSQCRDFGTMKKNMFRTPTPGESQRYHYGLFHGRTHHKRKKRCFSMKWHIETQKPNIAKKRLHSEILG